MNEIEMAMRAVYFGDEQKKSKTREIPNVVDSSLPPLPPVLPKQQA